eukprot:scaffold15698_cov154-Skeletonema_marinoi.AAC.11
MSGCLNTIRSAADAECRRKRSRRRRQSCRTRPRNNTFIIAAACCSIIMAARLSPRATCFVLPRSGGASNQQNRDLTTHHVQQKDRISSQQGSSSADFERRINAPLLPSLQDDEEDTDNQLRNRSDQDDTNASSSPNFNVVSNLVNELGEKLLDKSNNALPKQQQKQRSTSTSSSYSQSSLSRISKAHRSMMAKTSNMRRQRFVTGKYPLYVTVKQNPTKKWLGLAESQICLNGTNIEKSLASYDIFHWLEEDERRELHGDYELLSMELLAEIHVKKPGYVNILPKRGAGSSLTSPPLFDWKSWKSRDSISNGDDQPPLPPLNEEDLSEQERLWITGFSLTKNRGELHTLDVETGAMSYVNEITARAIKWPNEVASIPRQQYVMNHHPTNSSSSSTTTFASSNGEQLEDALLVTDGFLVPGKDKGGLYVVQNPTNSATERRVCLTGVTNLQGDIINGESDWFYHRAVWMDMTGDGRQSILAARAKLPLLQGNSQDDNGTLGKGQLVWLERPMPHTFDVRTGTPLDVDGTVFDPFRPSNTPWKLRILDEGPDVMFSVADLDPQDDTIEVIASQFFSKKLSLHSIKLGLEPKVTFRRVIDDRCGAAFSSVLADLDGLTTMQQADAAHYPMVVDSGSTVVSLNSNDAFSHLLVTSHECSYADSSGETDEHHASTTDTEDFESEVTASSDSSTSVSSTAQSKIDGGSLFAYRVPIGKDAWKTKPWTRSVIATGFKVQGQLSNMINPGAPGFVYSFFPTREGGIGSDKKWHRPLIGLSGDCAESAYILRPIEEDTIEVGEDRSTKYALMCEIKCSSTVGSLAVGYDDFYTSVAEQQSGYAKIYVPCYERDKVLVFALGSGEDEVDDGW